MNLGKVFEGGVGPAEVARRCWTRFAGRAVKMLLVAVAAQAEVASVDARCRDHREVAPRARPKIAKQVERSRVGLEDLGHVGRACEGAVQQLVVDPHVDVFHEVGVSKGAVLDPGCP